VQYAEIGGRGELQQKIAPELDSALPPSGIKAVDKTFMAQVVRGFTT